MAQAPYFAEGRWVLDAQGYTIAEGDSPLHADGIAERLNEQAAVVAAEEAEFAASYVEAECHGRRMAALS